jgi:hypothetical protein
VHGPVDHWPDFGSQPIVDHGQEQWPELAEAWLTGVPVRWTSPRRHGKQVEGTGISTPIGVRWQRGSDGRVAVDRGGSWSSLTRGCSRCEGEERRGAAGAVWRGGDGGAFYRVGRRWWGGETVGQVTARGVLSRHRLIEGETTGKQPFMGKLKRSRWHVGSAPYG